MLMIGVEFEFAAARRTGHSKEGGASGIERFSWAKESIVRPRHGHQKTPSFASIALPMATRLGASVAAGMSIFNEKAEILPFCSTHPVHHPRFGVLEKRHPVLP
jgi:hypothetical protein